ncbi:hypothetical protein ACFXTN_018692 [Malus domestica]
MPNEEKLDSLAEKYDVQSSIPLRMKHQATLEVDTRRQLKVKRHTIIHICQDVFHITIQEDNEDEILEEDVIAIPPQLDEMMLKAQQHLECYQARLSKAFNKKVRPRSFQTGDLVMALRRPIITTHKTKSKFTLK